MKIREKNFPYREQSLKLIDRYNQFELKELGDLAGVVSEVQTLFLNSQNSLEKLQKEIQDKNIESIKDLFNQNPASFLRFQEYISRKTEILELFFLIESNRKEFLDLYYEDITDLKTFENIQNDMEYIEWLDEIVGAWNFFCKRNGRTIKGLTNL